MTAGGDNFFSKLMGGGLEGCELWISDWTAGGTYFVKDINLDSGWSGPSHLTAISEILFFRGNDEIYVPKNFDLYNVTDKLNGFPHDILESYYVYTTLIAILAFDSHQNVFHNELFGTNKATYNTTKMKSKMAD